MRRASLFWVTRSGETRGRARRDDGCIHSTIERDVRAVENAAGVMGILETATIAVSKAYGACRALNVTERAKVFPEKRLEKSTH